MKQLGNTSSKSIGVLVDREWQAFERLPKQAREVLANCMFDYSSEMALDLWDKVSGDIGKFKYYLEESDRRKLKEK